MGEELEAYGTLVGLFPRVTAQMNRQMRKLSVALLALRTLVRFFPGVDPLMHHQILCLSETLPTIRTLEFGFDLLGVCAHVDFQVSRLIEDLVALRTLVFLFGVCASV